MTNTPQICPICSYENAADAQICVRCGTLLITSNITHQVLSDPPASVYKPDTQFELDLPPNTLAFLIEGQQEPRLVQNAEKVLLGRVETIGKTSAPNVHPIAPFALVFLPEEHWV